MASCWNRSSCRVSYVCQQSKTRVVPGCTKSYMVVSNVSRSLVSATLKKQLTDPLSIPRKSQTRSSGLPLFKFLLISTSSISTVTSSPPIIRLSFKSISIQISRQEHAQSWTVWLLTRNSCSMYLVGSSCTQKKVSVRMLMIPILLLENHEFLRMLRFLLWSDFWHRHSNTSDLSLLKRIIWSPHSGHSYLEAMIPFFMHQWSTGQEPL